MAYTIADHRSCTLTREETQSPVFNGQEYCGHVHFVAAWAVPDRIHKQLGLRNHVDLYLTSEGHWAAALEIAEHLLSTQSPPTEFFVKGASLGLFIPKEWPESINIYSDYRVYQHSPGFWTAEKAGECC